MSYSNLLVLCAAHGSPTRNCLDYLWMLRECGATIQLGECSPDVALTRNCQAGLATQQLVNNPELDWVLWLDHDMSAHIDAVDTMMTVSKALKIDDELPSVSGTYINRHAKVPQVAAHAVKGATEALVSLGGDSSNPDATHLQLRCVPALTGLGCLLQSRAAFVAHVKDSEWFTYPKAPHKVPSVCQSHLSHASEVGLWLELKDPNDDGLYWISEDFDYCTREFDRAALVYVAPVVFGHDSTVRLVADNQTVFPGLHAPQ